MKKLLVIAITLPLLLIACSKKEEKKDLMEENYKALQTQISALQSSTEDQLKQLQTNLATQIQEVNNLIPQLNNQIQTQLSELNKKSDEQLKEVKSNLEWQIKQLQDERVKDKKTT